MNTTEIYAKMEAVFEAFKVEHAKTTKKAQGQARKTLRELKKLASEYSKASIEENKKVNG